MNIVAIIVSYKNEEMTCNYTDKEQSKCKEITNVVIVNNAATVNSDTKIRTGIKDCEQYDGKAYYGSRVVLISNKENRFGSIDNFCTLYIKDKNISSIMHDIHKKGLETISFDSREQGKYDIYSTKSYKIGNAILKPFDFLNKM